MSKASGFQVSRNAAELYERYAVPYVLGPWAPELVELAALQHGDRVLDLACGTGVVARFAAPRVGATGQVIGMDLNAGMIAVARALPAPSGPAISWLEGSASATELPDVSIDVVLCQQGLQFFPDKPAALREMHRVLAPGGRVLLSVWKSAGPYNIAVADALERHVDVDTATKYRANRMVPDAEYLHRLLTEAGFRDVHVRPSTMTIRLPRIEEFVLCHLSASPVAAAVAALTAPQRAALAGEVGAALHAYADGDGVAVPDETNLVTAHA
jgi:ubiquinone/menaquinone biosynthesis C-methylase UbiE